MKIRTISVFSYILLLFMFTSCNNDDDSNMTLSYPTLEEDSRCPYIANCLWSGRARIRLEIDEDGETNEFDLIIYPYDNDIDSLNRAQSNNFKFTLLDVFPDPSIMDSRTDSVVVIQVDAL